MIMIDKTKITKEILEKAAKCETAEQLIALAKKEGFAITKAEAEAYLAELDNVELDSESLDKVAGGACYGDGACSGDACTGRGHGPGL